MQGHRCGSCSLNIFQAVLIRFNWGFPAPLADSQVREDHWFCSEKTANNEVN